MDEAKIKEVFSDQEFVTSLLRLETPEEVQAALAGRGVDMSVEDIRQLRKLILKMTESGKTELTEEDLNQVAGGSILASIGLGMIFYGSIGLISSTAMLVEQETEGRW